MSKRSFEDDDDDSPTYCCYVLQSTVNPHRTYVGITNDRKQRIRRHNGEISGGAKRTRSDRPWKMVAFVDRLCKGDALRLEWSMHNPRKRRLRRPYYGLDGRIHCMRQLLNSRWAGRFTRAPIDILIGDGIVVQGTHVDHRELLLNMDESDECRIVPAPQQLRVYVSSDGSCLANLPDYKLEAEHCVNHLYAT